MRGETNKSIKLTIIGDNKPELLENFIVSITSNNLKILNRDIEVSILDDDTAVFITKVNKLVFDEGDCPITPLCRSNMFSSSN